MNKPVPASPAQISDEQAVKAVYPHAYAEANDCGGYNVYATAKMLGTSDVYEIFAWSDARSRLESVEAAKLNIADDMVRRGYKGEPVEAVSTTLKCANCDHDLHDGERCRTAITVLPMKQCPCMRSMAKVSTPLPQQEELASVSDSVQLGKVVRFAVKEFCQCGKPLMPREHVMEEDDWNCHDRRPIAPLLGQDEPIALQDRRQATFEEVRTVQASMGEIPIGEVRVVGCSWAYRALQRESELTQALTSLAAARKEKDTNKKTYDLNLKTLAHNHRIEVEDLYGVMRDKCKARDKRVELAEASLAEAQKRIEALMEGK